MRINKRNKGFTLAEALIVIAIIAVLAALIVIAVFAYLRSMAKLEYDGYAKELFIAAQNHLSMAESQGYLGRTKFGDQDSDGYRYFVKDGSHFDVNDEDTVLNLMLPFGAVDGTVREGGCYLIRYHKDSATVLDVFYWQENGRYPHMYTAEDYAAFLEGRNDKSVLKTYGDDRSVIGWYGGEQAKDLTHGTELKAPLISVTNADKLTVTIRDIDTSTSNNVKLKLIVTGLTSGSKKEITLERHGANGDNHEIVLDDITDGNHFYQMFCSGADFTISSENTIIPGADPLIPGEDITLQAVLYNNAELTNVAYSPIVTTNSLFAYNEAGDAAYISYIRHLENLDPDISNVDSTDGRLNHVTDNGIAAKQTTDLTWSAGTYGKITSATGGTLVTGLYQPVSTSYKLNYDGQNYAIHDVQVETNGNAGLFTLLSGGDTVQNLQLTDFIITGKNAGALAGSASNATISNVVAYNNHDSATEVKVNGEETAGGLIGSVTGSRTNGTSNTRIERCAAALVVASSGGSAGGLVGIATGSDVVQSYAGGHTENGSYKDVTYTDGGVEKIRYNVTAADNAGGLIGQADGTTVTHSYSTCSATGTTVGGLIGDANGAANEVFVSNSYSTGLVEGDHAGAFIGNLGEGLLENCNYYDIINERFVNETDGSSGFDYIDPVGNKNTGGIGQIDASAASYETFVGDDDQWNTAVAYDLNLNFYYQGKYNLRTVDQLKGSAGTGFVSTHYGDWPAPEIWTINVPNS